MCCLKRKGLAEGFKFFFVLDQVCFFTCHFDKHRISPDGYDGNQYGFICGIDGDWCEIDQHRRELAFGEKGFPFFY
jgi:hypothetical protein